MTGSRPIPQDFLILLGLKDKALITLFHDLRAFILRAHPDSNELLYHTHALTSVFTVSEKLSDAFCMIPIYTNHLNLGFNKGTLINDPHQLLKGTGNLIRHIPVQVPADFNNKHVKTLVRDAYRFAKEDMDGPVTTTGRTISKIKPLK